MRIPADSRKLEVCLEDSPLPPGEGGAVAPGEGSPLHDDANRRNRGAGCPHPALPRHLLPKGEGLFFDFGQLCLREGDDAPFKKMERYLRNGAARGGQTLVAVHQVFDLS